MRLLLVSLLGIAAALAIETSEIEVSNANTKFASNLYKALAKKNPDDDIFFSPLGVHTVLSMLYQGAGDSTKEALSSALQVHDPALTAEGYSNIMNNLNNVQNVTLHIANKIYIKQNFNLKQNYKDVIVNRFQSEIDTLNFSEKKKAAETINSWVKDKTKGKIEKLLVEDDFSELTRLVLVNAIYFKGAWKEAFKKDDTRTEPFYVDENKEIDVQMMHRKGAYKYKNEILLEAQVVELPFQNEAVSMYIVLPYEKYGIQGLEAKVQEHGLNTIFENMDWKTHLDLAVPKFKLETTMDLEDPLKEIGLGVLFDKEQCNLKDLLQNPDGNIYVSKAIQKAYIEFNEEGAEATAATAIIQSANLDDVIEIVPQFYANHPFLVLIKEANNVLFYGKIVKPVSGDVTVAPRAEPSLNRRPEIGGYLTK